MRWRRFAVSARPALLKWTANLRPGPRDSMVKPGSLNNKGAYPEFTNENMDFFQYCNRVLHCEEVPVPELAQTYGSPLYVYSQRTLLHHLAQLQTAFAEVEPLLCF